MAGHLPVTSCDPMQYFSPKELCRLDERFNYALHDATCLVFWTGVPPKLAHQWATRNGLQTLTMAMGPLFSDRGLSGTRYGKSKKRWSKYMQGASAQFAEYACRCGRNVVVVTNPPPHIYSTRKRSNYQDVEEPILKGAFGGCGTVQIDYVHPTVTGAETFRYQIWPVDKSSMWYEFLKTLLPQGPITRDMGEISAEGQLIVGTVQIHEVSVHMKHDETAHKEHAEVHERQTKPILGNQKAQEQKEANRKRSELDRNRAQEKKEARQKKEELEEQKAAEQQEARRKKEELKQQKAAKQQEARRKKEELKQQKAAEQQEARRKKEELKQQKAAEQKEARKKKKEMEQQKADEQKETRKKKKEMEQQKADEQKEARRKTEEMKQQKAAEQKEARRKKEEMKQQMAQEQKEAKRK